MLVLPLEVLTGVVQPLGEQQRLEVEMGRQQQVLVLLEQKGVFLLLGQFLKSSYSEQEIHHCRMEHEQVVFQLIHQGMSCNEKIDHQLGEYQVIVYEFDDQMLHLPNQPKPQLPVCVVQ